MAREILVFPTRREWMLYANIFILFICIVGIGVNAGLIGFGIGDHNVGAYIPFVVFVLWAWSVLFRCPWKFTLDRDCLVTTVLSFSKSKVMYKDIDEIGREDLVLCSPVRNKKITSYKNLVRVRLARSHIYYYISPANPEKFLRELDLRVRDARPDFNGYMDFSSSGFSPSAGFDGYVKV